MSAMKNLLQLPVIAAAVSAALLLLQHPGHAQFPYNATYPFGVSNLAANPADANTKVQTNWNTWKQAWTTASGAGANAVRVLFQENGSQPGDTSQGTVSEGIGYGMLLAVYFNEQTLFDQLYAYYKSKLNGNGLMGWKVRADGSFDASVGGSGSATDADQDVAAALCFAYKRWTASARYTYLTEAQAVIGKIKQFNIVGNIVTAGDWDRSYPVHFYPSYFSPAWYRIYKSVTNDASWDGVISRGYSLLYSIRNANTGLIPRQVTVDAAGAIAFAPEATYQYDSVRMPWRVGVDYSWYGNADGLAITSKIADFYTSVTNPTTSNLSDPWIKASRNLDGSIIGNYEAGVFTSMAAIAEQVKGNTARGQYFLNVLLYGGQTGAPYNWYYDGALHVLGSLYLTGNFPNLYTTSGPTAPTFALSATVAPTTVTVSGAATITATVQCNGGSLTNGVVDLELYNSAGTQVQQKFYSAQSFTTGQSRTYTWNLTAPATAGTYTVRGGVFNADWTTNYAWSMNLGTLTTTNAVPTLTFYDEALATDWADWSWNATVNLNNTSPIKTGTRSASVVYTAGYGGLSLRKGTALSTSGYTAIKFWVHGGTGANKSLNVFTQNADSDGNSTTATATATVGQWTEVTISLASLGNPATIKRLNIQNNSTSAQSVLYIDNIRLVP